MVLSVDYLFDDVQKGIRGIGFKQETFFATCIVARFDIALTVANHEGLGKVNIEVLGSL